MTSFNRPKWDEREFKIEAVLRSYTYHAFVTKRTGKLRRVTAGCRNWPDFETAKAHYRGERPGRPEWSDAYLLTKPVHVDFFGARDVLYARRAEARAILAKLQEKVWAYQGRKAKR